MTKYNRLKEVALYSIFAVYLYLLVYIFFLSRLDGPRSLSRSVNLIPFSSIWNYLWGGPDAVRAFAFGNVVGNIVIFIPLGIYLPLFKRGKRLLNCLLIVCMVSFVVELLQWISGIGSFDIDDVILNAIGGLLGYVVYRALLLWLRDEGKVRTAVTAVSVAVGLPVIYFFLFVLKLRL